MAGRLALLAASLAGVVRANPSPFPPAITNSPPPPPPPAVPPSAPPSPSIPPAPLFAELRLTLQTTTAVYGDGASLIAFLASQLPSFSASRLSVLHSAAATAVDVYGPGATPAPYIEAHVGLALDTGSVAKTAADDAVLNTLILLAQAAARDLGESPRLTLPYPFVARHTLLCSVPYSTCDGASSSLLFVATPPPSSPPVVAPSSPPSPLTPMPPPPVRPSLSPGWGWVRRRRTPG